MPTVSSSLDWLQARAQEAFLQGRLAGERKDPTTSRRWLERARRLSNGAVQVDFALAIARMGTGDAQAAIVLLRDLLRRFDFREGWTALAAAHRMLGDADGAAHAVQQALSRHAPQAAMHETMHRIALAAMWPGWCGLSGSGRLLVDGADAFSARCEIRLDGQPLTARLPTGWRRGRRIELRRGSQPLLGSPLHVASILRSEGFVGWVDTPQGGALEGWLWHPGEPERAPNMTLTGADNHVLHLTLEAFADRIDSETPLARPRRLFIPAADLPLGELHLRAEDGSALIGSPLDPALLAQRRGPRLVAAARSGRKPMSRRRNPDVDIVIPVYRHLRRTLDCIESVRETAPPGCRIIVVEDASPDAALSEALGLLASEAAIVLIRNPANQGFPRSANTGIAACAGRDVILLNSDTLVAPGWICALREAAYSAPDIGTATPFSNDASILSYPEHRKQNPVPDRTETRRLMAQAREANRGLTVEIPTGNGFCWYLRRDCLDQAGLLRQDIFAQGYGEENEFCLRARNLGWRHVGVPGAYVGHVGNVSFGAARRALMARNLDILNQMHPGYDALIQAHIARDPLADARRRLDVVRFQATTATTRRAVLLITHDESGGVARIVRERARTLSAQGIRPIVLRPSDAFCLVDVPGEDEAGKDGPGRDEPGKDEAVRQFPNLRYELPGEIDALLELLSHECPQHAEWHHLLGHHPSLRTLCERLAIPYDIHIHDYASFCARIALIGPAGRYCGEPEIAGCVACIAAQGSNLGEPIMPADLRLRSAAEFSGARDVIAPSNDAARRIARHFPGIRPRIVAWEDDRPTIPLERFAAAAPAPFALLTPSPQRTRICAIGGIGTEKGYDVLLGCLRDARARGLPLDFVVVGHTRDDETLLEAGCLDVTGAYREDEAVALVRAQNCDLALLPSIWPETWCFTLAIAWRAGLAVACFDIGAQAERIRATGRGAVLPLGLPIANVNDTLLQLSSTRAMTSLHGAPLRTAP